MKKKKLTERQKKLFHDNFDLQAYNEVKKSVCDILKDSTSFLDLWEKIHYKYDCDVEYADDFTIILCEAELDRSRMETDADYVGVSLVILWNDESNTGKISDASLYSTEISRQYEADLLCRFDPDTCEVVEWIYHDDKD